MMNKLILKFILLFRPAFERFDIDTDQLAVILSAKLTMDDRRPNAFMAARQQQKKEHSNSSWRTMMVLFFLGCFMVFFLNLGGMPFLGHTVFFCMFMVMITLTLIADFTSVLIDVRDNYIILPRPVKDTTFTIARILHISIHVSKLVIALTLPGLAYLLVSRGLIAGLAFFIEVFSATVLTIFLVNMVYLLVLKVSSPQRFKDSISYFQIVFSIVIFAAYQMLPRLIASTALGSVDLLSYKIAYLLPPVWFASFYDILLEPQHFSPVKLVLAATGIIMPFVTLVIVVKVLAPGFNQKLSSIAGSGTQDGGSTAAAGTYRKKQRPDLASRLSSALCTDLVEQAGFRLTWWLTSRYRDFKIKVYPAFAYVPVYFVYFLFMRGGKRGGSTSLQAFKEGSGYIFLTYLTSFVVLTVLQQVTQAERFKAAWVMFSTPHNKPGKILAGMFKALMVKYFIPYYVLVSIFSLFMWGPGVLNDLLFAFFNILIFGLITALFTVKYLPFSQPVNTGRQGGKVIVNLVIMALIGGIGFLHYLLYRWEPLVSVLAVISTACAGLIYYYFQKRSWQALEADYD